jgi:anti-sigma regulatory factor (Ser/Thr protein kinase)
MWMSGVGRYASCQVERSSPDVELIGPEPVEARRAVAELARRSALTDLQQHSLLGAVSEVVTNARVHGRPPVCLRGWRHREGVLVTVTDGGDGPSDPEVGVRPMERDPGDGGLGLWLAHQLCDELSFGRVPDGFRVRLWSGTLDR